MVTTAAAWTPLELREVSVPNRVWLSPMCQYSTDGSGVPTDWHLGHYISRAVGGAGLVMVECTAIAPEMRTTGRDLGLWSDDQVPGHARLVDAIHSVGAVAAVQLGAAGRKSSHDVPWENRGQRSAVPPERGGWQPIAPSTIPFADLAVPTEMADADAERVVEQFAAATRRAHAAGYDVVELHGANGYLIHTFLSPLANLRGDRWGGALENRMRFPLEVVAAVRAAWPDGKPLLVRMPAADLLEGGLTTDETTVYASRMAAAGVDMIDLASGVLTHDAPRGDEPLHNARFGPQMRASGALVAASGLITEAAHLEAAVPDLVDAVLVGRAMLRDPYWPLRARGLEPRQSWPVQYHRAF
ncbi:NADH:flavin oxidoreductase/NADH oxidase [Pseudonocardia zijingensis]|uniref:NADH:flavin oxidoreductase/NADH oxidase n=1 Tax=Pseudonocardia zijingensis TaxID=153376 RepID=A0ABN1NBZ7_9PSEU